MTPENSPIPTRRDFLRTVGGVSAASVLSGIAVPHVHAAVDSTIQLALIGAGGRGTGAAANALAVAGAPTKLVAMADVFEHKLNGSHKAISDAMKGDTTKVDVPPDRRFIGFDAYKKAIDCLKPGDIAIFATPVAFRWVHFSYAIEKGVNVFMEKPVTTDGPTSKRMLELAADADQKGLKVGVGLMVRHCRGRQALKERIDNGEIGDIITMRSYRMHGPVATCFSKKKEEDKPEVMYQIERFHSFLWASGGLFSDFYIHQIDECCWMKGKWPVKAHALGGRNYRGDYVDQNFDSYSVEYTFDDGTNLFFNGRTMINTHQNNSSVAHGSKGSAIISTSGHTPGKVRTFSNQIQGRDNVIWAHPQPETNPYQNEWDDLLDAIMNNKPFNEVQRGVEASLATSMGRMSAHTGREVTWDEMLNCTHEFAPGVADLVETGEPPVKPDGEGRYPIPLPGIIKDREYGDVYQAS
jgi:predicted dehydrogenase